MPITQTRLDKGCKYQKLESGTLYVVSLVPLPNSPLTPISDGSHKQMGAFPLGSPFASSPVLLLCY